MYMSLEIIQYLFLAKQVYPDTKDLVKLITHDF